MTINIRITAGPDKESSSVLTPGVIIDIVSPSDQIDFGVTDNVIKDLFRQRYGLSVKTLLFNGFTLPPPSDFITLPSFERKIEVIKAEIISVSNLPSVLAVNVFSNTTPTEAQFKSDISQSITQTFASTWSSASGTDIKQSISYGIEAAGNKIGGETSFSASQNFSQGGTTTKSTTTTSTVSVSTTLQPGEKRVAELNASKNEMLIEVQYKTSLIGTIYGLMTDRQVRELHADSLLSWFNLKNEILTTETIKLDLTTNATVELRDLVR
ncbi:MAG: follicular epithelium yolk protein subunit [Pseudomonas sp.]|nr:follicular epithelium yolk protein subunit [Pseudomonas sp.]